MVQSTSATETNNGPHLSVPIGFITSQAGKENLAFIDALRGLAALYVVICHVGFIPTPPLTGIYQQSCPPVMPCEATYRI